MIFTFYKDLLSENQLRYQLISQLKYGFMDNFIEQLPNSYKKVIQNNKIFFWSADDHYYTLEPQTKWADIIETHDNNEITVEDVIQKLYRVVIESSTIGVKEELNNWKLKLLELKDIEDVSKELDIASNTLSYLESEIKSLKYLEPYQDEIVDSFTYVRNEIHKLGNFLVRKNELDSNEYNPPFKVRDKHGAETEIVKLLYSIYDMNLLQNINDNEPIDKKVFMEYFGLNNYHQTLSQSFKSGRETFLKIFDKLKQNAEALYDDKLENRKK